MSAKSTGLAKQTQPASAFARATAQTRARALPPLPEEQFDSQDLQQPSEHLSLHWLGIARSAWRTAPSQQEHDDDGDQHDEDQSASGPGGKKGEHRATIAPRAPRSSTGDLARAVG